MTPDDVFAPPDDLLDGERVTVDATLDPAWVPFLREVHRMALDGFGHDFELHVAPFELVTEDYPDADPEVIAAAGDLRAIRARVDDDGPFVILPLSDELAQDAPAYMPAAVAETIVSAYERALTEGPPT